MIRPSLLFPAVLLSASVALMNPRGVSQQGASGASHQAQTADSHALAKTIYSRDCAMCHGDDGRGKTGVAWDMHLTLPDWSDQKALTNTPDSSLFNVIRNGNGKMPPEDTGRATDQEVKDLIAYIRSLSKAQAVATSNPGK